MWRQAELRRRNLVKRLLVYLGDFEVASAAREPKGVPHRKSFGDRHMLRPGQTIRQSVGDPIGAIDEHRRNDRLASRVPQLTDDIAQTLRRQLALAFVPLGDGGRGFCRRSTVRTALHLVCDAIGLKGKAVAVGGRRQKRRQHDPRVTLVDDNADHHAAAFQGAKSESDRTRSAFAAYPHACTVLGAGASASLHVRRSHMPIGRIAWSRPFADFPGLQGGLQSVYSNPIIRFQHAYPRRVRELVTAALKSSRPMPSRGPPNRRAHSLPLCLKMNVLTIVACWRAHTITTRTSGARPPWVFRP